MPLNTHINCQLVTRMAPYTPFRQLFRICLPTMAADREPGRLRTLLINCTKLNRLGLPNGGLLQNLKLRRQMVPIIVTMFYLCTDDAWLESCYSQ